MGNLFALFLLIWKNVSLYLRSLVAGIWILYRKWYPGRSFLSVCTSLRSSSRYMMEDTLIFCGRGSTLKELNALETLVRVSVRKWVLPTSKSLNTILSGLPMKAEPLKTLAPIFWTLVMLFRWACLARSKCRFYSSVRVPGLMILSPSSSYSVNAYDWLSSSFIFKLFVFIYCGCYIFPKQGMKYRPDIESKYINIRMKSC